MTGIEQWALEVVAMWLPRIERELARANKLEAFRLAKEYSAEENKAIIDKIMED